MHRMILDDRDQELIRRLYAQLRHARPPATATSKQVMGRARGAVLALTKKPPAPALAVEFPELRTVLDGLLTPLLGRQRRSDEDVARLTVALYVGFELLREMKEHVPGPHDHTHGQPGGIIDATHAHLHAHEDPPT